MYNELGISALWRRAISEHDWWNKFDIKYHAALTLSCREGDAARARELIQEHANQVSTLVRDLIDKAGGAL
jgi:DNA-binding GntR family transcriptional regulator